MNTCRTINRESERFSNDQQRSESANPAVNYREVRMSEDVAEDLSRPLSSSYPQHVHRPSAHSGIVGAASVRLPEEIASSPMKLPPPAHSHHRRAYAAADHILVDTSLRHRSPARNMPSPRGYAVGDHLPTDMPPREDLPWPARRTVPPPLPYLPPNPCSIESASGAVPKFSATGTGPPPLIHEPVKGVSGAGSIVLGTPLSPEQRRRHFELSSAVGMLYKKGNDPDTMRSGFAGALVTPPPPSPQQEGQFSISARQSSVPWPPSHLQQSVIRSTTGDANVATSSRDLLYSDLMTARQMPRSQVAAPTDVGADRRRTSPRSAGSYAPPSWQHSTRSRDELTGTQYLDTVHRFDVLNTMLPWPVRPPANVARYSVCGEPSRQCYTPPMPIQKAFISREPASGSFTNDDRPSRQDGSDVHLRSRFPDLSCGGPKISPHYRDVAESIAACRHAEVRRSPARDSAEMLSVGGPRPDIQGNVQASGSGKLTAARLIDAFIIDQINQNVGQTAATSPGRKLSGAGNLSILERLSVETSAHGQSSASGPAHSPASAEKQDQPPKPSPCVLGHSGSKDFTLNDHITSLIMDDFKQKDAGAAVGLAFDTSTSIGKIQLFDVKFVMLSTFPSCSWFTIIN